MTESLGEIRAALAEVSGRLGNACQGVVAARARIAEAVELLVALDGAHHESVLPPELARADAELEQILRLISGGAESVAAVEARL